MEAVMAGYGQFCPMAKAAEVFAERWTPLVIRELLAGSHRFTEIQAGVPLMSPTLLSQRLKTLERAGIVQRRTREGSRATEYLTQAGYELGEVVVVLGAWGQRWAPGGMRDEDLDPWVLMRDMHRRVRLDRLPPRRVVVFFHYPDAPAGKGRHYWLVLDGARGEVDICLADPGYEVDLTLETSLHTMVEIWMGRREFDEARRSGALALDGPRALVRDFPSWFLLNFFAGSAQAESAARRP
jgi:DNA-binding HxlR family transcriptional regulator